MNINSPVTVINYNFGDNAQLVFVYPATSPASAAAAPAAAAAATSAPKSKKRPGRGLIARAFARLSSLLLFLVTEALPLLEQLDL